MKNFRSILAYKYRRFKALGDITTRVMAMGERSCFAYAIAFSIRKVCRLSIPLVLDSPY